MEKHRFKNSLAENVFRFKYAQGPNDTWDFLSERVVEDVCGTRWGTTNKLMSDGDRAALCDYIKQQKFLPGGRYLYYAGRPAKYFNNCYLLRAEEDTREEWASLTWRAMSCLMTGGGIGIDYSRLRPSGSELKRTGGVASGPIPLMYAINEIGRNVMQGGSRRSAIYASLNWRHADIPEFLKIKDWDTQSLGLVWSSGEGTHGYYSIGDAKRANFNFNAPLDMTNISINYDNAALSGLETNPIFLENCKQAMMTGEPGFSFNFGDKENETLRNALTSNSALH
ncbi:MAG: hypothetical protein QXL01_03195 [Thermoplasmatales archaeon]